MENLHFPAGSWEIRSVRLNSLTSPVYCLIGNCDDKTCALDIID